MNNLHGHLIPLREQLPWLAGAESAQSTGILSPEACCLIRQCTILLEPISLFLFLSLLLSICVPIGFVDVLQLTFQ